MTPSHRLRKLRQAAVKRLANMHLIAEPLSRTPSAEEDRLTAWLVIEALNLWAEFVRAYYLSGAIGARTESGSWMTYISVALPTTEAAIKHAVIVARGKPPKQPRVLRRDEPAWHDKGLLLRLLKSTGASNLAQVQAALSVPSSFRDCLPTMRNFYAHRCGDTYQKAANVAVKLGLRALPTLRPTEIMCAALPKRPQNLFADWLDEMWTVVELLCA